MSHHDVDLTHIKELLYKYDQSQRAGQEATKLKKQLVPLIKSAGLTKTKFNFGDRTIAYSTYSTHDDITQRLMRSVITKKYPQINVEQFITDIYGSRKRRTIDTLKVAPIKQKKNIGS